MISNQVFFSICIPTYNSVYYLTKLINSVFSQTFNDFEIIISDDSTTDDVMNYCNNKNDNRISYFKHKSINSATENWNSALQNASGKYRMLVHHDDYFFDDNILADIYQNCINFGEKDAYFLGFKNENSDKKFYYSRFNFKRIQEKPSKLLFVNYLSAPSCLVIRENVKISYDINLKWLVDVEFYKRLFLNHSSIGYLPDIKMVIGGGADRITNTVSNKDIISEFLYLRERKIYNYNVSICLIKIIKIKIYIIEYFKRNKMFKL